MSGSGGPHGWKEEVTLSYENVTIVISEDSIQISVAKNDGTVVTTPIDRKP